MKKILIVLVSLLFIFGCNSPKKEVDTIKIGAILPLTGDAALYGNNAKEGIDLALEQINSKGSVIGKTIQIIYEDSKAEPKTGVAAFQKLTDVDKVPVIIGGISSSVTLAFAPLAEKQKIVVLSPAATSPKLSNAGKFIFRNWTSDAFEATVIADYAINELKINKMGILYLNNDYGKGLENAIIKEFTNNGKEIVIVESFAQNQIDFKNSLTKIKASDVQALYIISYPDETVIILRQIKELNLKILLLSTSAFQDDMIIKNAGATAENVIYPYPVSTGTTDKVVANFFASFEKKYNKNPGIVSDTGFDALNMIVAAIKNERSASGEAIQKGLMKLHDFKGASGTMTFDENGDIEKEMKIKTVKNKSFVEL